MADCEPTNNRPTTAQSAKSNSRRRPFTSPENPFAYSIDDIAWIDFRSALRKKSLSHNNSNHFFSLLFIIIFRMTTFGIHRLSRLSCRCPSYVSSYFCVRLQEAAAFLGWHFISVIKYCQQLSEYQINWMVHKIIPAGQFHHSTVPFLSTSFSFFRTNFVSFGIQTWARLSSVLGRHVLFRKTK